MDCPHCQGRFGAHVPGCSNAGKSSESMENEWLLNKITELTDVVQQSIDDNERLQAEIERLREEKAAKQWYPIQEGDYGNKDTTI